MHTLVFFACQLYVTHDESVIIREAMLLFVIVAYSSLSSLPSSPLIAQTQVHRLLFFLYHEDRSCQLQHPVYDGRKEASDTNKKEKNLELLRLCAHIRLSFSHTQQGTLCIYWIHQICSLAYLMCSSGVLTPNAHRASTHSLLWLPSTVTSS
jgi:hypothetical protein